MKATLNNIAKGLKKFFQRAVAKLTKKNKPKITAQTKEHEKLFTKRRFSWDQQTLCKARGVVVPKRLRDRRAILIQINKRKRQRNAA